MLMFGGRLSVCDGVGRSVGLSSVGRGLFGRGDVVCDWLGVGVAEASEARSTLVNWSNSDWRALPKLLGKALKMSPRKSELLSAAGEAPEL